MCGCSVDISAADLFIQLHYKHLLPDLNHDKFFHLFYQMNAKSYGEKKNSDAAHQKPWFP